MLHTEAEPASTGPGGVTGAHHGRWSPPTLLLVGLIAQTVVHVAFPMVRLLDWPWTLVGVAPVMAGMAVMILGDLQFKRVGTPVRPGSPSTALVTDGVFAYSRNPMYVGMVLVLCGVAMMLGTTSPLLVPPVIGRVLSARFIRWEEAALHERFGQDYEEYARRVSRWFRVPTRNSRSSFSGQR